MKLAAVWRRTERTADGDVVCREYRVSGLCLSIQYLGLRGLISPNVMSYMIRRVQARRRRESVQSCYHWPCTRAGARQRVKFCLAQAAKLKRRERAGV